MNGNGNGLRKVALLVAAIVGTVVVSIAGAFFAFGQTQQQQLVRLEASESEDSRQRQIDQATVKALNEALRLLTVQLGAIDTRLAVLEAKVRGARGAGRRPEE